MASEVLSIVTMVQGAVAAARDIGKIGGAIDSVGAKAAGLRGKLGAVGGQVSGALNAVGLSPQFLAMEGLDLLFRQVRQTFEDVSKQTGDMTKDVGSTGRDFLKSNPTVAELNKSIAGMDQSLKDLMANPLTFFLGGGDAAKEIVKLRDEYKAQRDAAIAAEGRTEALLRQNLTRPQPAPEVTVNITNNTTVSARSVITAENTLWRSSSRTRVVAD